MTTAFTPVSALAGGALIGLSALLLRSTIGRVSGISGIIGNSIEGQPLPWRLPFLLGLPAGVLLFTALKGAPPAFTITSSTLQLILAGLLVGFGTRMGNGCTSGHGICGMSRGSVRSITATLIFMVTGMLTAVATARFLS